MNAKQYRIQRDNEREAATYWQQEFACLAAEYIQVRDQLTLKTDECNFGLYSLEMTLDATRKALRDQQVKREALIDAYVQLQEDNARAWRLYFENVSDGWEVEA